MKAAKATKANDFGHVGNLVNWPRSGRRRQHGSRALVVMASAEELFIAVTI